MPDYRILIDFQSEPFFCGAKHAESNEMVSLEFIPGTTLRGSLAAELFQTGNAASVPAWFSRTGPCWTPALPTLTKGQLEELGQDAFVVPMPLSFLREKSDPEPFEKAGLGIVNSLLAAAPRTRGAYQSISGSSAASPEGPQWTRFGDKWLIASGSKPINAFRTSRAASMHVGLHYGRQANRDQALFSRRAIGAKSTFLAWVREHPAPSAELPASTILGKRRSAGNGFASLDWTEGGFPWQGAGAGPSGEVNVQFISDAIVTDSRGNCLSGLDAAAWSSLIGHSTKVVSAASASRRIRSWSVSRGLPGTHNIAITAGSVYRLAPATGAAGWHNALDLLAANGLGNLHHEGYGWISVNPAWLNMPFVAPGSAIEMREPAKPKPIPFPGLEGVDPKLVRDAVQVARDLFEPRSEHSLPNPIARKFGDLASYASRVSDVTEVINYLNGLADRPLPRGWKEVANKANPWLNTASSIELVRFFLTAVETYHA